MAVDFKINLAKDLVSSSEQRAGFHRGMMFYLLLCFVALSVTAYFSSINLAKFLENSQEQRKLKMIALAVSGLGESAFKNPEQGYDELQKYSNELASLRQVLGSREQLLPVLHHLFKDLPEDAVLQNLSASKGKLVFAINVPTSTDAGSSDPVRELKAAWESSEELMKEVSSILPVKGQRHTVDGASVFNVQFECVLKK